MTTREIIIVSCAYLVALIVVAYFTRATFRRIVDAFAGGAAVGVFGMGAIVLGNALGLWRVPILWVRPYIADGAAYAGIVLIGHAVMRLMAGTSGADRLRR